METVKSLISFEDEVAKLFEQGKIRVPIHLSGSTDGTYEHFLINLFKKIDKQDYVFCTWRNHMHYLLKGGSRAKLLDEIQGKESGICGGKAGSMHTIDVKLRFYSSAIVAGNCALATGVAAGIARRGGNEQVYCFVGDGGADSGHFWEAYRYAYGHRLQITFVIEDNDRSVCTKIGERWGCSTGYPQYMYGPNLDYISFEARWPHAGTGKFIPL